MASQYEYQSLICKYNKIVINNLKSKYIDNANQDQNNENKSIPCKEYFLFCL